MAGAHLSLPIGGPQKTPSSFQGLTRLALSSALIPHPSGLLPSPAEPHEPQRETRGGHPHPQGPEWAWLAQPATFLPPTVPPCLPDPSSGRVYTMEPPTPHSTLPGPAGGTGQAGAAGVSTLPPQDKGRTIQFTLG